MSCPGREIIISRFTGQSILLALMNVLVDRKSAALLFFWFNASMTHFIPSGPTSVGPSENNTQPLTMFLRRATVKRSFFFKKRKTKHRQSSRDDLIIWGRTIWYGSDIPSWAMPLIVFTDTRWLLWSWKHPPTTDTGFLSDNINIRCVLTVTGIFYGQ